MSDHTRSLRKIIVNTALPVTSIIPAAIIIIGLALAAMASPPLLRHAVDDPLAQEKARVYEVYGVYAVRGMKVHHASVCTMLNSGVSKITGVDDPKKAWHMIIGDDDIVALKFQSIGSRELGTNTALAQALLEVLYDAGFKPENFMIVGLDELPPLAKDTKPFRYGWQEKRTDFYSDQDYLAKWVDDVTAIINIPLILDDNIIGLRAAMANLAWPVIKSPARLYINAGDPFIADIYNLPQVKNKVRLNIANTLRMLYQGGPIIKQCYVYERGSLLFSLDPVALDCVALEIIERARGSMPMPNTENIDLHTPYLETAAYMGIGYDNLNRIDYSYIKHEKW